jgi:hypothetical protein
MGIGILMASCCHAATCNEQSISGSPSKEEIADYLTKSLSSGSICSDLWPPTTPLEVTYNANNMFFKRTRTSADILMTYCNDAYTNIISQCVLQEEKWGGEWVLNGQYYSIRNNVYPANGIILPGSDIPTNNQSPTIQPGPFTTEYIPGVTANTVTTTELSDQTTSTVLPVW